MTVSQINQQYFQEHKVAGTSFGPAKDITGKPAASLSTLQDKFSQCPTDGEVEYRQAGQQTTVVTASGSLSDGDVDISFRNEKQEETQHTHAHFGPTTEVTTILAGSGGDWNLGAPIRDNGDKFIRVQEIKGNGMATSQDFYFATP